MAAIESSVASEPAAVHFTWKVGGVGGEIDEWERERANLVDPAVGEPAAAAKGDLAEYAGGDPSVYTGAAISPARNHFEHRHFLLAVKLGQKGR